MDVRRSAARSEDGQGCRRQARGPHAAPPAGAGWHLSRNGQHLAVTDRLKPEACVHAGEWVAMPRRWRERSETCGTGAPVVSTPSTAKPAAAAGPTGLQLAASKGRVLSHNVADLQGGVGWVYWKRLLAPVTLVHQSSRRGRPVSALFTRSSPFFRSPLSSSTSCGVKRWFVREEEGGQGRGISRRGREQRPRTLQAGAASLGPGLHSAAPRTPPPPPRRGSLRCAAAPLAPA